MLLEIHPDNPSERKIRQVVDVLEKDGVIIYPTDTVYALGCDLFSKKGLEKIARIRGVNPSKARFSFICENFSQLAEYAAQIDNEVFRLMKQLLPGPYTFILKASHQVPKIIQGRRASIGVRVPDNNIPLEIVRMLGRPIITASLKTDAEEDVLEYLTDTYDIEERFGKLVDIIIDGGAGGNEGSTVIDCTTSPPELIRAGAGPIDL
ncbi:MAG: L-threonylcarbamoyladenylate synthase [Lewinella sp.]|jgi:tRNA threonylcarbamoyl adenosine modification protein (Sua5/YciO/YrdC/YwlC family)|uniref:L-threonylcarbamoyladenylate synthase n=1 Tax=Lewinella sp. TaxID=2004506 RepID=UPI003D6B60EA